MWRVTLRRTSLRQRDGSLPLRARHLQAHSHTSTDGARGHVAYARTHCTRHTRGFMRVSCASRAQVSCVFSFAFQQPPLCQATPESAKGEGGGPTTLASVDQSLPLRAKRVQHSQGTSTHTVTSTRGARRHGAHARTGIPSDTCPHRSSWHTHFT